MVFVTGGTGLLGTHILLELLSRGKQVRALKRSSSNLSTIKSVFEFYLNEEAADVFDKIEWVEGDLLDIVSLESAIQGCSIVYHCAAKVSFLKRDFEQMWSINKVGTENIVNVCLGFDVKKLCYVSSTATIGRDASSELLTEENKWSNTASNSNYSITKYSAEMEVWRGIEEGLNAVILNPSIIIGPGNWNQGSIGIFKAVQRGLKYYTPGMNAFVDARDVATISAELGDGRGIYGERFLVVSENIYFKDLFEKIARELDLDPPRKIVKPWMANMAWKIESLMRIFFRRKQTITRETAKSAMTIARFSNKKISHELNFQFISIESSIQNATSFFKDRSLNPN